MSNKVEIIMIDDDPLLLQENVDKIFGDLSSSVHPFQICSEKNVAEIENELKKLISDEKKYIVLLDTELSKIDSKANDADINAVLQVLLPKENVYIMLYTGVDPDACRWLHNEIKSLRDESLKAKLFHYPLDLYFFHNPKNYEFFVNFNLKKELEMLAVGNGGNNWIHLGEEGKNA